jgi:uncharacterized protein (DUF1810 family)/serine/threonine protein phosphatase PrpC
VTLVATPAYSIALGVMRHSIDIDLSSALLAALEPLAGQDPVVYLVDFAHQVLIPVPNQTGKTLASDEAISSTMPGRAFITSAPVIAERDDGVRVWVPVVHGTMRTGVLAVTVPVADEEVVHGIEMLGVFAGLALAASAPLTDLSHIRRRGQAMSLPATMQWGLMPPLSAASDRASIAGALEPAYDIAGDGFDYAINADTVDFAIFDGMGHGVASSLLTGLAIGAYRHARRERSPMPRMHAAIEQAISAQYDGEAFATGILGRLSTMTGEFEWSCAGHPAPLLLRDRSVVAELDCEPGLPFGLGDVTPELAMRTLQPGDAVLLYTDGVVEARTPGGEEFGLTRLIDLLEREAASGRTGDELLRRLVRAVLDHHVDQLRDDATLLLVQWLGADVSAVVPSPRPAAAIEPTGRSADRYDLDRFVTAQNAHDTYDDAVAELRRGRKISHWMWFVFPQLTGLGSSPTARRFAIASLEEAKAYLEHPVLGPRLVQCASVVAATRDRSAMDIFGGVDAQKLRSSMTLFSRAAPEQTVFTLVLERHYDGLPDAATDRLLAKPAVKRA